MNIIVISWIFICKRFHFINLSIYHFITFQLFQLFCKTFVLSLLISWCLIILSMSSWLFWYNNLIWIMFVVFWSLLRRKSEKRTKLWKIVKLLSRINQASRAKDLIDQCRTSSWIRHQSKWIDSCVEFRDREIHFADEWSSSFIESWKSCFCFCRELRSQSFCFRCNETCTIRRLNFASFLDFSWRLTIYVISEWRRRWWAWQFEKKQSRDFSIALFY